MLKATDPPVDDVIRLEASINQTSTVAFKLNNQFPAYANFTAAFTPESPYEFTCFPTQGVLPPPSTEGTDIMISFTPTEYGRDLVGKLTVMTDEMQWSYEVVGSLPKYRAPRGKRKVSSYHSKEVARGIQTIKQRPKKNYMKEQMKEAQEAAKHAFIKGGGHRR